MSSIKERAQRSLEALDAGRPLVRLIDQVLASYPDPYMLAHKQASRILLARSGKALDPRFVWWHQFQGGSGSDRSFTGWQHSGTPRKSSHITELVVNRFDAHFQQAPDELDQYGGFYRQGAQAGTFNERNEVAVLGSAVQQDLWALDFAVYYRAEIERFWNTHNQDFRVLARINLLGHATVAKRDGRITATDLQRVRQMVHTQLLPTRLPTVAILSQDHTSGPLTVSRYAIDQVDRAVFYSLAAEDGRVLLYRPWSSEALQGFDSEQAMASWLRTELQDTTVLAAYLRAAHVSARDPDRIVAVRTHLKGIADSADEQAAAAVLTFLRRPVTQNLFVYLADLACQEMRQNADTILSNADLRRAMWSGYLSAFLRVFGGFAPMGWPITLTLLGVSVAKVALDVETALTAMSTSERKQAMREAVLDSLFAALNMVDLGFASSFALLSYEVPVSERNISLASWEPQALAPAFLQQQAANQVLDGELGSWGRLREVSIDSQGGCWILLEGVSYRVRYSHELAVWLIVSPDAPFAFGPLHPVQLDDDGVWRLLAPPRLVGGNPPVVQGMPSVTSEFWNRYLRVDTAQSGAQSTASLRRQKSLLRDWPVHELEQGVAPAVDENGLDCVHVDGAKHYSYRYGRDYYNSLIEYYTSDESKVNDVFRSGTYRYGDEDDYISDLANSLEALPKSNQVTLYRGGHSGRGTGGNRYRTGALRVGDVLINTDITSFTENPYKVGEFASTDKAHAPAGMSGVFDDSSIIFELPAGYYHDGTPISAFSLYWDEGETLFLPGKYFRIDKLEQVHGEHYRFIHVVLRQISAPVTGPVYDLRSAELFDRTHFVSRIRTPAIVERFFPPPGASGSSLLEQ
ncbi:MULTISPECIES: dermonecrotic toxin domain-containing protein [unclassified Pseudomonas]|uniref:dermonecrotic toxin domain-containing protein n=1 Tax=unclassified Pseudomonas TaxID=196821 RepID=UPI0035C1465B